MTEKYLIGIDIGSSFSKSSIFDIQGNSLGAAKRDTHPDQPRPGVAEYDGPTLLQAVLDSLKELMDKSQVSPDDVAGICLDGMISGTLGIFVTYLWASTLFSARVGLFSGIILATSFLYGGMARTAGVDMMLTLFTTAALYCFSLAQPSYGLPF